MKLEQFTGDELSEWREEPCTMVFLAQLQRDHEDYHLQLETTAAAGREPTLVAALGGKASECRRVMDLITKTRGTE